MYSLFGMKLNKINNLNYFFINIKDKNVNL